MNPLPVAANALRRFWRTALAMALLVALATALGTAVGTIERGMRHAAAQAADAFDLVIGAPGSSTQLVLTSVYLQPDTVPLLDPALVGRILAEPEAAWSSPIGFGDQYRGSPVVGVAPAFISNAFANHTLASGRAFEDEAEAVIGAAIPLRLGDSFSPTHGRIEMPGAGHVHAELAYKVVGRLPPSGTPWDNAILVPIESVWELHGLGNGHPPGVERIGPPWEVPAGVPAIVLKPRSFAGAYQLRARYRTATSTAVFPGEVLASLFRTLGDVRALLSAMATATAVLVIAAVFLAFSALIAARSREHAVLRAIGAPPRFLLAALWLECGLVLTAGVAAGLLLGWAGAALAAGVLGQATGVAIAVAPGVPELGLAALILLGGLVAALIPASLAGRVSPGAALKR